MGRRTTCGGGWGGGLALGVVLLFSGCSAESRQALLPRLLDGVPGADTPAGAPPTQRFRRDLLGEIEGLKRDLAEAREALKVRDRASDPEQARRPIEQVKSWEEARDLLPKDADGGVDWVRALAEQAIAPRPGLGPDAPRPATLDLEVTIQTQGAAESAARFSHGTHTPWLSCGNCHPGLFPYRRPASPPVITMDALRAGQVCGACHGRVTFGVDGACGRCHPAMGEGKG